MRVEKWVSPKKLVVMEITEDTGQSFLKVLDYRKNKSNRVEEITLARW